MSNQEMIKKFEYYRITNTGGTVGANKLSLKSLALSGLFGVTWFGPNCTTGVIKKPFQIIFKSGNFGSP